MRGACRRARSCMAAIKPRLLFSSPRLPGRRPVSEVPRRTAALKVCQVCHWPALWVKPAKNRGWPSTRCSREILVLRKHPPLFLSRPSAHRALSSRSQALGSAPLSAASCAALWQPAPSFEKNPNSKAVRMMRLARKPYTASMSSFLVLIASMAILAPLLALLNFISRETVRAGSAGIPEKGWTAGCTPIGPLGSSRRLFSA